MIAMTKQEYIAKQQIRTRLERRRGICWPVVVFGGLLAMIPVSDYVEHRPELAWVDRLGAVVTLAFLLTCCVWVIFTKQREQRDFGLKCRGCGKNILNSQVAIATGNCGYCGERLFD